MPPVTRKRKHAHLTNGNITNQNHLSKPDSAHSLSSHSRERSAIPSLQHILCKTCQSVPLDTIFSQPAPENTVNGTLVAHLGDIPRERLTSTCPLCRLLAEMIFLPLPSSSTPSPSAVSTAFSSKNSSSQETTMTSLTSSTASTSASTAEYALHSFPSAKALGHLLPRRNARYMPDIAPTAVLGLIRLEKPHSQSHSQKRRKPFLSREIISRSGYISQTSFPDLPPNPLIVARAIAPESIDFDVVNTWLEFCRASHAQTCKPQDHSRTIDSLRVVDCDTRTVVSAPPQCCYIALSYVWGFQDRDLQSCRVDPTTGSLPEDLPTVIEDAMEVVREIGRRYLWVDRYCISQEDEADQTAQMGMMDVIYNRALVTIVAAAGTDSSFGLPGVGRRHRVRQPWAKVGEQVLVATMSDPQDMVKDSKWMTRAWASILTLLSETTIPNLGINI